MTSLKPHPTRIFIAAPSDMALEREQAARIVEYLAEEAGERDPFAPYRWEVEQDRAWDAGKGWQTQIPRPSAEVCEVLICILGERVGSPLPDTDPLPADFSCPAGVVFPCTDEDALFSEGSSSGAIPLTGTLFEFFDAVQAQRRPPHGRPHILLFLKGDTSIANIGAPAWERAWGLQRWYEDLQLKYGRRLPPPIEREYNRQTTFLSRFFDTFLGNAAAWRRFADSEDFAGLLEGSLRAVLQLKKGEWDGNPYKRLERYEISEATIFYGRTFDVRKMVDRLREADRKREQGRIPLLILDGESGSGKSSTLRAGIAGRLVSGRGLGTEGAFHACVLSPADLPGTDPILALMRRLGSEDTLSTLSPNAWAELAEVLPEHRVDRAVQWIRDALDKKQEQKSRDHGARPARLFLAVDQFEEVLNMQDTRNSDAWKPVLQLLVRLADQGLGYAALSLKTDWLGELKRYLASAGLPSMNAFVSYGLDEREFDLDAVIGQPFERCGLELATDLHDHLKEQAKRYRSLPLLSVALSNVYETWKQRSDRRNEDQKRNPFKRIDLVPSVLTLADYAEAASLGGAIERLGGDAYRAVGAREEHTAEEALAQLLRRLVRVPLDVTTESGVTLRDCALDDIPQAAVPLLHALVANRLLLQKQRRVLLVHEAVLQHWSRATAWLKSEQGHLVTRSELEHQLRRRWQKDPTDENTGYLLPEDVDNGERMLVAWRHEQLDAVLKDFIHAAIRHRFAQGSHHTDDGTPRLVDAVQLGDEPLTAYMLNRGADPNAPTPIKLEKDADGEETRTGGSTAIQYAADNGSEALVRVLAERGADTNLANAQGYRALDWAAHKGHGNLVRLLHEQYGAAVDNSDMKVPTALALAASNGKSETVRLLLAYGADPNRPAEHGWTPLMLAAANGHVEMIDLLLERGIPVDTHLTNGLSALMAAANGGHVPATQLLLRKGASVDSTDENGDTALLMAARSGHAEIVRLLLDPEHGADLRHRNQQGNSPLQLALGGNHLAAATRLVEAGAQVPPWYTAPMGSNVRRLERLRGETLRQHVRQLLASTNRVLPADWPSPALVDGDWIVLDPEEAVDLLARAAEAAPAGLGCGVERVDAVRVRPLPFYADTRLCEARGWMGDTVLGYLTFLDRPGGITWLDGTSSPIHELSKQIGLLFNSERRVLEYLQFFCAAVQGAEGTFNLVESPDRLRWLEVATEDTRTQAAMLAQPAKLLTRPEVDAEGGEWEAAAIVHYETAIFRGRFRVAPSGMVTMVTDYANALGLDLHVEVFRDGIRTLVPRPAYNEPAFSVDLMRRLDVSSDPENLRWPIPALIPGDWIILDQAEARHILVTVADTIPPGIGSGIERVDAVRVLGLSFYEETNLYEARTWRNNQVAGYLTFIIHPGGVTWLAGDPRPIHELNAACPIRLNGESAALEYLRFFSASMHAEHGTFMILESGGQLVWPDTAQEEKRSRGGAFACPAVLDSAPPGPDGETGWTAAAALRYGDAVFRASIRVGRTGSVEMLHEDLIADDLGAYREVFVDGVRTFRGPEEI